MAAPLRGRAAIAKVLGPFRVSKIETHPVFRATKKYMLLLFRVRERPRGHP